MIFMNIIATAEHNSEHNSPCFWVTLQIIILEFSSRICELLVGRAPEEPFLRVWLTNWFGLTN